MSHRAYLQTCSMVENQKQLTNISKSRSIKALFLCGEIHVLCKQRRRWPRPTVKCRCSRHYCNHADGFTIIQNLATSISSLLQVRTYANSRRTTKIDHNLLFHGPGSVKWHSRLAVIGTCISVHMQHVRMCPCPPTFFLPHYYHL